MVIRIRLILSREIGLFSFLFFVNMTCAAMFHFTLSPINQLHRRDDKLISSLNDDHHHLQTELINFLFSFRSHWSISQRYEQDISIGNICQIWFTENHTDIHIHWDEGEFFINIGIRYACGKCTDVHDDKLDRLILISVIYCTMINRSLEWKRKRRRFPAVYRSHCSLHSWLSRCSLTMSNLRCVNWGKKTVEIMLWHSLTAVDIELKYWLRELHLLRH